MSRKINGKVKNFKNRLNLNHFESQLSRFHLKSKTMIICRLKYFLKKKEILYSDRRTCLTYCISCCCLLMLFDHKLPSLRCIDLVETKYHLAATNCPSRIQSHYEFRSVDGARKRWKEKEAHAINNLMHLS